MKKQLFLVLAGLALSAIAAFGGGRISVLLLAGRYDSKPAVSLIVPAEVMVFQVSIRSSAESFEDRLKDIQTSRNALVDIATKQNWQLKMDQVVVVSEGYRKFSSSRAALGDLDANSTPLLLVPLAEQKDTVALVRRIRLIAEHQSVPKKLQVTVENFWVGLEDPEKFRPEILRQVRQHIDATAAALGPNIDLECTGLDEPIMAQQIEERVVEVSLPFHVTYSRKSK